MKKVETYLYLISEDHSLVQLSDVVLGASRNQVGDASERQRLQLKVLKSRHTGMTGEVDKLLYDQKTGRLVVYEKTYLGIYDFTY